MLAVSKRGHKAEIYAVLRVSPGSELEIRTFWDEIGISNYAVQDSLHLTVYYAQCLVPGIEPSEEPASIYAETVETRMMVMAPGGENPRPDRHPGRSKVGARLTKRNTAIPEIQALRRRFFKFETHAILGNRKTSSAWASSFGARNYQPHVTMLRSGNGLGRDLSEVGKLFRGRVPAIEFDQFEVMIVEPRADPEGSGSPSMGNFSDQK